METKSINSPSFPSHLLHLLTLLLLFTPSFSEIKSLRIEQDSLHIILLEKFGFTQTGHTTISVSDVSIDPPLKNPESHLSQMGFFLLSEQFFMQVLSEEETEQSLKSCILQSQFIHLLFDFKDLTIQNAFNNSYPITYPDEYGLFFANCLLGYQVSMNLRTEVYNMEGKVKDYLPAGQTQLPKLYFCFFFADFVFLGIWFFICLKNKLHVHRIHLLMGAFIFVKTLNLISAAENKQFVKKTGTPHGWDVVVYVFQSVRVIMVFIVILLMGTGWSFLKPFLQEREKKVLLVVIPLQVLANVASDIMGETGPFIKDWRTWKQVFLVVDIICCFTIISPIVWPKRSLRVVSKTDRKAARNLAKSMFFRRIFIVVVVYLYLTRIVVYALQAVMDYRYRWVSNAAEEMASLAFYVFICYKCRPVEKKEYFVIDQEEEEAAEAALQDDDFEI